MLVGCGMKYDFWTVSGEYVFHTVRVADVSHESHAVKVGMVILHVDAHGMEG